MGKGDAIKLDIPVEVLEEWLNNDEIMKLYEEKCKELKEPPTDPEYNGETVITEMEELRQYLLYKYSLKGEAAKELIDITATFAINRLNQNIDSNVSRSELERKLTDWSIKYQPK